MASEISKTAVIHEGAIIKDKVAIHDNVVIYSNVIVGEGTVIFAGAVLGRPTAATHTCLSPIDSEQPPLKIGKDCVIGSNCCLWEGTEIGNEVLIGDMAGIREQCKIGDLCLIARGVTLNMHAVLGKRVKVIDNTHITANCIIEDDVFVSTGVFMVNDNLFSKGGYHDKVVGPHIKKKALIGAGAILLPGVVIGEGAVIGAGAVVTKNIPPATVAMGVPAKVVRRLE